MTLCIALDPAARSIRFLDVVPDSNEQLLPGFRFAEPRDFASILIDDMPMVAWYNIIAYLHTDASGAQPPMRRLGQLLGRNHGNLCVLQSALPEHQTQPYAMQLPCGHTFNLSARAVVVSLAPANLRALLHDGAVSTDPIHQQLTLSGGNASDERMNQQMLAMYTPMLHWDQAGDIEMVLVDGINPVPLEFFSTHGDKTAATAQIDALFTKARS